MSSPEERWWSIRAGEYVLGTLRGQDLELFERILSHDTAMQAEVAGWERRFGALNETAQPSSPGRHVWPRILERVRLIESDGAQSLETSAGGRAASTVRTVESTAADSVPSPSSSFPASRGASRSSRRRRAASRWRMVAGLASAASLVLAVLLFRQTGFPGGGALQVDGLAVVLSDEDGKPYFLVETDYEAGRVRVTALTPPSLEDDRNFQLWQAVPDRSSVRAVALLPEESGRSRTFDVTSLIDGSDLFGVSLEPDGAPTDSGPTGPVVAHGDFLATQEDD